MSSVTGSLLRRKNQELVVSWYIRTCCDYFIPQDIVQLIILFMIHFNFIIAEKYYHSYKHAYRWYESKTIWINSYCLLKYCLNIDRHSNTVQFVVEMEKISTFISNITFELYLFHHETAKTWNENIKFTPRVNQKKYNTNNEMARIELYDYKKETNHDIKSLNVIWNYKISEIEYRNGSMIEYIQQTNECILNINSLEKLEWLITAPNARHIVFVNYNNYNFTKDYHFYIENIFWYHHTFHFIANQIPKDLMIKFMIRLNIESKKFEQMFQVKMDEDDKRIICKFNQFDTFYYQIVHSKQKWIKPIIIESKQQIHDDVIPFIDDEKKDNDDDENINNPKEFETIIQSLIDDEKKDNDDDENINNPKESETIIQFETSDNMLPEPKTSNLRQSKVNTITNSNKKNNNNNKKVKKKVNWKMSNVISKKEKWQFYSSKLRIKKNIAKRVYATAFVKRHNNSVFGAVVITKNMRAKWKIKVVKGLNICIGIANFMGGTLQNNSRQQQRLTNRAFAPKMTHTLQYGNLYKGTDEKTTSKNIACYGYGKMFDIDDEVVIILNMHSKTLSYQVNGDKLGIAPIDLMDGNYRLAASFDDQGDEISILKTTVWNVVKH